MKNNSVYVYLVEFSGNVLVWNILPLAPYIKSRPVADVTAALKTHSYSTSQLLKLIEINHARSME